MKSKIFVSVFTATLLVINQFFAYSVYADEYSISGNGEGSSSNVEVKRDESANAKQSNQAEVNNEVKTEANTGNNEASGNTGDEARIETGYARQQVTVENSGNNNVATNGCCPDSEESSAQIIGNGSGSSNGITQTQNSNTQILLNNNLRIRNNVQTNANTGDNEASDNTGDVTIVTGNVNTRIGVANQNLNNSFASVSKPDSSLNTKVAGNGVGSSNQIESDYNSDDEYVVNNYLELNNNLGIYSNTGGNKASRNNGKVFITTGNVYLDIILSNRFNSSGVVADCGCKSILPSPTPTTKPSETPSSSPSPSSPPSGGGNNGGGGGSGGSFGGSGGSGGGNNGTGGTSSSTSSGGGGQVLGAILPSTGGFSLFQATLFALLMLSSGVILRFDYGKVKKSFSKVKHGVVAPLFYEFSQIVEQFVNWRIPVPAPRCLPAYC